MTAPRSTLNAQRLTSTPQLLATFRIQLKDEREPRTVALAVEADTREERDRAFERIRIFYPTARQIDLISIGKEEAPAR